MELKNKNVFVTGSTRGIGLAVAHKFASLGANVVLNGRSEISEDLLAQFADYGVTVVGISGDILMAKMLNVWLRKLLKSLVVLTC